MSRAVEDVTGINVSNHSSTDEAVRAQQRAGRHANAMQERIYNQTREDLTPFRQIGIDNLKGLSDADFQRDFSMADFRRDPGYNFRLQEGMKALEGSAAARGSLNSGATLKALSRYGQDFASQEYNNAYNRFNMDRDRRFSRLSNLANIGLSASGAQSAAGQNYANQYGQNMMGMANAQAAAAMNQANQFSGLLGAGMGGWLAGR